MVRRVRIGPIAWPWFALLACAAGTAVPARSVSAEADPLVLDDAWFMSVARAESAMCEASARSVVDSTDRATVAEQIQIGVHVLGSVVQATIAADTVLERPLATVRPRELTDHRWPRRIFRATGVIAAVVSLVRVVAVLSGAGPQATSVLAYVGGSAAGVGGVLDPWLAPSGRAADPLRQTLTLGLESDLRDSVHDTEIASELLWVELRQMALDSCATRERVVWLARRYTTTIQESSVLIDSRVVRSLGIARSCAECPGFAMESRQRCGALASQLDAVVALWQERRWLIERSKKNTLDYLVLADRP